MTAPEPCPSKRSHPAHVWMLERRSPVFGPVRTSHECPGFVATDPASRLADALGIQRYEAKARLFPWVYGPTALAGEALDELVDSMIEAARS